MKPPATIQEIDATLQAAIEKAQGMDPLKRIGFLHGQAQSCYEETLRRLTYLRKNGLPPDVI